MFAWVLLGLLGLFVNFIRLFAWVFYCLLTMYGVVSFGVFEFACLIVLLSCSFVFVLLVFHVSCFM